MLLLVLPKIVQQLRQAQPRAPQNFSASRWNRWSGSDPYPVQRYLWHPAAALHLFVPRPIPQLCGLLTN